MSVMLYRIATDTTAYQAHDMGGKGAEKTGGRWNRPGRPVVYTARSIALAALETVVHLDAGALPLNRFLVEIEIPDDVWTAGITKTDSTLPVGWTALPTGMVSLDVGDDWLASKASALLMVPSVIVPEECNVLINPLHGDATRIKARKARPWFYDSRLSST